MSNTLDVVRTDEHGNFSLPNRGNFVMVSVPAGFRCSTWWQPAGSDNYEFVLESSQRTLPYRFMHLTDLHLSVDSETALQSERKRRSMYDEGARSDELETLFSAIEDDASPVDAVFVTGDLVDLGINEEFVALKEVLANRHIEIRVIPGNHDHMAGRHESVVSPNNYLTNMAFPENYENHLGPRWYSFDIPGLHVVALDWLTFELGLDDDCQLEWLRQDLQQIPASQPWMLLFHDQPSSTLLDRLPRAPIATFSGHWHTSRIIEVEGTLHVNTPPATFGGLDYSPPMLREMTWDGTGFGIDSKVWKAGGHATNTLSKATIRPGGSTPSQHISWQQELKGAGHRQAPVVCGERVIVTSQFEDGTGGAVEAFQTADGQPLWQHSATTAVKAAPALAGETVIYHDVTGEVVGLCAKTGQTQWRVPSSDPLRRFAWCSPVTNGSIVIVGDQADLRCIDVESGEVLWRRTDIAPHHNLVTHASPLIHNDQVYVGYWPSPTYPVGLNLHDGTDAWDRPELAEESRLRHGDQRQLVMGTAGYDEGADLVIMPGFDETLALDPNDGTIRWRTRHNGGYSASPAVPTTEGILVTIVGRGLQMLNASDGTLLWEANIEANAPFPMKPYSKCHAPVLAHPTVVDDQIVLPGLDGKLRRFSLSGDTIGDVSIGDPIAAPLVLKDSALFGVTITGCLVAIDVKGLHDPH